MTPKTKIIATLGPASSETGILRRMMLCGMDVVRLNFSHGAPESHSANVRIVRRLNKKYRRHIRVLQDLKGNRIRIGRLKNPVPLARKQTVFLVPAAETKKPGEIPFDYAGPLKIFKKGIFVYIDDGNIRLQVIERGRGALKCAVVTPGLLKERKGINIPEARLEFPVLNEEDRADLEFGLTLDCDYIAQSFVRTKEDVLAVKRLTAKKLPFCKIVAKIEAKEALDNIDSIIEVSDAIMVARGDMGINFPVWQVPMLQKNIIRKCNSAGKSVITATQMLESMTEHPIPTRAEVSDVANAILDGTNFVMLSAETAAGRYPVEAVRMMNEIIKYTETNS